MRANRRVRAHHRHFAVGQLRRLEQQRVGNADLADVVQRRRAAHQPDVVSREAERRRQLRDDVADAFGMPAGVVVAVFGRHRQPLEHLDARFFELLRAAVHGFEQRAILLAHVLIEQPRLELIAHAQRQLGRDRTAWSGSRARRATTRDGAPSMRDVAGDHEHRQVFGDDPRMQRLEHVEAVAVRHVQVEDDQIGVHASASRVSSSRASVSVVTQ